MNEEELAQHQHRPKHCFPKTFVCATRPTFLFSSTKNNILVKLLHLLITTRYISAFEELNRIIIEVRKNTWPEKRNPYRTIEG